VPVFENYSAIHQPVMAQAKIDVVNQSITLTEHEPLNAFECKSHSQLRRERRGDQMAAANLNAPAIPSEINHMKTRHQDVEHSDCNR